MLKDGLCAASPAGSWRHPCLPTSSAKPCSGNCTYWGTDRFVNVTATSPDIITIMLGTNDVRATYPPVFWHPAATRARLLCPGSPAVNRPSAHLSLTPHPLSLTQTRYTHTRLSLTQTRYTHTRSGALALHVDNARAREPHRQSNRQSHGQPDGASNALANREPHYLAPVSVADGIPNHLESHHFTIHLNPDGATIGPSVAVAKQRPLGPPNRDSNPRPFIGPIG